MMTESKKFLQKCLDTFSNHEPTVLDSSNTKLYKECKRKYFYRVVLGRNVKVNNNQTALDFGKGYHKFRELLFKSGEKEAAIAAMQTTIAKPQTNYPKFEYLNAAKLREACGIALKWAAGDESRGIITREVEWSFNLQLPDGSLVGGRLDRIVEWNGKPWLLDYKTTSQEEKWFKRQFNPNDQVDRYLYGYWKLHGEFPGGIIIEVLYTKGTKDKETGKTPAPTIYTLYEHRTEAELNAWLENTMEINAEMKYSRENLHYPMEESYKCSSCPFRQVCTSRGNPANQITSLQINYGKDIWDFAKDENDYE